ncbi:single-strand binding protein family domain-containing protein [Ditylenchus destructor]|uniref:Single-strand binding protein family domain-containing protein n=1 Tax=Ditylenchus destructor TaxID=166010 RepID=A0AAD4MXT7_9BILA|nr:single-strand binding protein family domain-containing protein [Ditylenchus destructor]
MQALRSLQFSSRMLGRVATTRYLSSSQKLAQQADASTEDVPQTHNDERSQPQLENQRSPFQQREGGTGGGRRHHGINRVELLGGVAADPQFLTTRSGDEFAIFRVFTNIDHRRANGDLVERVEVHEVSVFRPLLNTVRNSVRRGSRVFICGKLTYLDRADGLSRVARITADNLVVAKTGADVARAQMNEE